MLPHLCLVEIRDRRALLDVARPGHGSGLDEKVFNQRGLPRPRRPYQDDIADLVGADRRGPAYPGARAVLLGHLGRLLQYSWIVLFTFHPRIPRGNRFREAAAVRLVPSC